MERTLKCKLGASWRRWCKKETFVGVVKDVESGAVNVGDSGGA